MFGLNKNEKDSTPKVIEENSLPTNPGDPALVVDLPDGQKLILGQIEPGTIIEVATWRGTGRPDSRTTRLLLGTSVNEENKPKAVRAPEKNIDESNYSVFAPRKSHAEIASEITGEIPVVKKELVKGRHGVAPKKTLKKTLTRISLTAASIATFFVLIASNGVINFQTVEMGITTSLGGPESIVALTQKTSNIKSGDVVVIELPSTGNPTNLLAKVSELTSSKAILQANGIQYEIPNPNVKGKVRLVIPFIGTILNLV